MRVKKLCAAALVVASSLSFSEQGVVKLASHATKSAETMASPVFGDCKILNPLTTDRNDRYCSAGYGVTYNGFLISNDCYSTMTEAMRTMRASPSCEKDDDLANCSIVYTLRIDETNRYCSQGFGVSYKGFMTTNSCYANLDAAFTAMESTRACAKDVAYGDCRISFPNRLDNHNRYCNRSYGILYDGLILDNQCYDTVDKAFSVMEQSEVCAPAQL